MRIYLDTCSLQRPLDDRSQARINIEAEAMLTILRLVESERIVLLNSEALEYEIERIPDSFRKVRAFEMLKLATERIELDAHIQTRAQHFVKAGVKALDALHIASAVSATADYFCTCDDQLLKKLKRMSDITVEIVSPLELVGEVVL